MLSKGGSKMIYAKIIGIVIPDHDYEDNTSHKYPGDINPGYYSLAALVDLLRDNKNNPDVIQFIADMMEE
jgi:hypothetical protein